MPRRDSLDPDRIQAHLQTHCLGQQVVVFESTSSTNDIAFEYARNAQTHGLLVLAEEQASGRGRRGHLWQAARGSSLLGSVVLINETLCPGLLSLATAVAVAQTIGTRARIKWPNDILIQDKKVCGILVETRAYEGHRATILGVGINCHQQRRDFPPLLRDSAVSLDMVGAGTLDRVLFLRRLLVELETWLDAAHKDAQAIVAQWQERSVQYGHRVRLCYDGQHFEGLCLGVDPFEGLILKLDLGGIRYFSAAQTHVVRGGRA